MFLYINYTIVFTVLSDIFHLYLIILPCSKVQVSVDFVHFNLIIAFHIEFSGRSKISHTGAPTPGLGVNLLFGKIFPENCMKMKEFGPRRGRASLAPPWICQWKFASAHA